MKASSTPSGIGEKPYYTDRQIELVALEELGKADLLPKTPEAIRVERFVEKRFGVSPSYENLPDGVLGFTRFSGKGVEEIVISRSLDQEGSRVSERRVRTTIAHEAGHGLLHAHLFVLDAYNQSMFGDDDVSGVKMLCREPAPNRSGEERRYDGRWWEVQANKLMSALLLPRVLVSDCIDTFLVTKSKFGGPALPAAGRDQAARLVAEVFDVNPVVARIRLDQLFAVVSGDQLTL